ncbi:MAG: DUF4388 domain-containing protein [Calditrichaceae bacterium]
MALVGNLKDLKLPSLIQLNCMERNTAKLTIERGGKFGFIYFENGQVVHAEFEPEIGEKAVYRLLTLYDGTFKVESDVHAPVKTIKTSWNSLLLEGLHQLDNADEAPEHRFHRLFERLLTVKGVQSVKMIERDGTLIAKSEQDSDKDNEALHAFSMLEAGKIADIMSVTEPEFVSVLVGSLRYVVTSYNQFLIIMVLNDKTKLDVILPLIKQAMG